MATQTIYATQDATADEINPGWTGNNTFLGLNNSSGHCWRTFIDFDITSAAVPNKIESVYLYLYSYVGDSISTYFERILDAWNETTLTWNDQPNVTPTNRYAHAIPAGNNFWLYRDVTKLYNDAKNAGNVFGIRINPVGVGSASHLFHSLVCANPPYIIVTSTPPTHYYVKTSGDDALLGGSWATAWATINKAATTVIDGSTVHIGFGNYLSEPASNKIAPQNAGTLGIKYLCETAGTGGGAGTVTVEQN